MQAAPPLHSRYRSLPVAAQLGAHSPTLININDPGSAPFRLEFS